jgi:methionyl-tRNA formyltransferase
MNSDTYVVAGRAPWSRESFDSFEQPQSERWIFVSDDASLLEVLQIHNPRYVFFLHWSNIVPNFIVTKFECVCFHMADLPYGRGGSPLQNLVARGHDETVVTAFRMDDGLDTGPIYAKRPLSLFGTAEEVYLRAGTVAVELMRWIVDNQPSAVDQEGVVSLFRRRKPMDSRITGFTDLDKLHRFIQMLDAEGYPSAYLDHDGYRYQFRRAARYAGRIEADVKITKIDSI